MPTNQLYEEIDAISKDLQTAGINTEDIGRLQDLIEKAGRSHSPHSASAFEKLRAAKAYLEEGSLNPALERLGAASRALRGSGDLVP
jgi:hypothetical protein